MTTFVPLDVDAFLRQDEGARLSSFSDISNPSQWDQVAARAEILATVERVNAAYPEGCPIDGPGWDEAEALVDAAYHAENMAALHQALADYEAHALAAFAAYRACCRWCGRSEPTHAPPYADVCTRGFTPRQEAA